MANIWTMKKLWDKVYISPLTYIVILLSLLAGYIKYIGIIASILFIHELGHIFMCFLLKKRIREDEIKELIKNDTNLSLVLILRKSYSQTTTKKPTPSCCYILSKAYRKQNNSSI